MADHLIDEVDEALRRERIELFWRKFGQYVVVGSICVLLLTIGSVIWQGAREEKREAWSSQLLAAQADIDLAHYGEAEKKLAALEDVADGDLGVLARLWLAQVRLRQHNPQGATETLSHIADTGVYGDLAQLLSLSSAYEEEQPTPQAFRYTAMEMTAAALLAADEKKEAAARFHELVEDVLTPRSMRERATLIGIYLKQDTENAPVAQEPADIAR